MVFLKWLGPLAGISYTLLDISGELSYSLICMHVLCVHSHTPTALAFMFHGEISKNKSTDI